MCLLYCLHSKRITQVFLDCILIRLLVMIRLLYVYILWVLNKQLRLTMIIIFFLIAFLVAFAPQSQQIDLAPYRKYHDELVLNSNNSDIAIVST